MINKKKSTLLVFALVLVTIVALIIVFKGMANGQETPPIRPALLGQPISDFALTSIQGETVRLSDLRGKNILLIFSRGYAAENYWCTICNYKYVELVELEKSQKIREKYNTEVLFVFPYDRETVQAWVDVLPGQLAKIHDAKYPSDPEALDDSGKRRMERWRELFPKDFSWKEDAIETPFPILFDTERTVSKGLGLFATEWSGSKVDQNIPSVFIVDKNGILRFKYVGQNTVDRPSYGYLFTILELVNSGKL